MKVSINNSCNSKCPYCFAGTMGIDNKTNMSLEDFKKILNWLILNNDHELTLLGGEPTIHPDFEKMLDIISVYKSTYGLHLFLLTNGVFIGKYADKLPEDTTMLINVNNDKILNPYQYNEMINSLNILKSLGFLRNEINEKGEIDCRTALGCNIHYELDDYSYFWDLVDRFNVKKLRVSVASPQNNSFLNNRDSYFKTMKPLFIEFVQNAFDRKCEINLDCSLIPPCYYTPEELYLISKVASSNMRELGGCLSATWQILPNMQTSCCFGDKEFENSKTSKVLELTSKEIGEFYKNRRISMQKNNYLEKCKNCLLKKNEICYGGCFGFTDAAKENVNE